MADKPRTLQQAAYRYNCQPCKQRKTKCDRVKPCASCHLRGTQDKCYVDEVDGSASFPVATAVENAAEGRVRKKPRVSTSSTSNAVPSSSFTSTSNIVRPPPPPPTSAPPVAVGMDEAAIREHIATLRKTIDALEASLPIPSSTAEQHSRSNFTSPYNNLGNDPVLTTSMRLVWGDVAHLFPPKEDVERILSYFLREMVFIMIPIQERQLWRAWQKLIHSNPSSPAYSPSSEAEEEQQGISRSMVGSLLLCLASTSFLIPQHREEELDLTRPMADQRDFWITSALALVRSGTILSPSSPTSMGSRGWLHYVDSLTDASLDRFGFETLTVRIFALLGMSELSYHLNGECLRRAIRINLFDESSPKTSEILTYDDPELTNEEVMQMRRRIGAQLVVTERWTCLYTGRPPMIDDEAESLPMEKGGGIESEELSFQFSRFVSKLRLLPAQLTALTSRKAGDWATQRARDQEAVGRILDIDRGLCALYDPALPRASLGNRSHSQILAELPELLEKNAHLGMSDDELNQMHREFAEALVLNSSWLSLRCLVTSNLMFLPWVQEGRERYYALNLARRLIELLPGIWMMASSPYVPFSSSWISRHLFLACTVLSVPILGQEPAPGGGNSVPPPTNPNNPASGTGGKNGEDQSQASPESLAAEKGDFAPSRLQKQHFFSKLPPTTSKHLHAASSQLPASSSIDLDWFSGKLVEIASLFSKLAERGDQTAGVNTKLIHALLNSRAELRDRVLDKLGQKRCTTAAPVVVVGGGNDGREYRPNGEGEGGSSLGRIGSQRDLTSFVMASSVGKSSPSSASSSTTASGSGCSPVGYYRAKGRGGGSRREVLAREKDTRVGSPSLIDLANAVDTYTSTSKGASSGHHALPPPFQGQGSGSDGTPPSLPSFSPAAHPSNTYHHHQHPAYPSATQQNTYPQQNPAPSGIGAGYTPATATAALNTGSGWDWSFNSDCAADKSATALPVGMGGGGGDVLANVPLLLDTQDWLAILDGVELPL